MPGISSVFRVTDRALTGELNMEKNLIGRGVLAGIIAGLLAFVFARIFAEPQISKAIDYESGRDAAVAILDKAAGMPIAPAGPGIFSRTLQANIGIGVGVIAFGAAMGALFAVAYAVCLGRVGRVRPRTLSLLVAAGGFLGIYLMPFINLQPIRRLSAILTRLRSEADSIC